MSFNLALAGKENGFSNLKYASSRPKETAGDILTAKRSHLYSFHKANGNLTEFAGFEMPLWYRGIIEEHNAVRNAAGIFDVSHMGRFSIKGDEATSFLDHVLPTDASKVKESRAFYSTICNERGGIIDDTVTCKISQNEYLMVVNAANIEKDLSWLKKEEGDFSVEVTDLSDNSALLAVQGPFAKDILQQLTDLDLNSIKRFGVANARLDGINCLLSRTGYTGEDGFEVEIPETPVEAPEKAERVWNRILDAGRTKGIQPCGLGARDLLRLEAGMCLYGQDMDETTTPVEAGLSNIVVTPNERPRDYVGKKVIDEQMKEGVKKKRVAFMMEEGGVPRHGFNVEFSNTEIGQVTSGSFSPLIKKGIGMAYVPPDFSEIGKQFRIRTKSGDKLASVSKTPFYDTSRYGYSRKKASV